MTHERDCIHDDGADRCNSCDRLVYLLKFLFIYGWYLLTIAS